VCANNHVSDEDLELYLLARLPSHQLSVVELHLTTCTSCTSKLSDLAGFTFRVLRLSSRQLGGYGGPEKRREHRIPADEPAQMQAFSPFSPAKINVQITDVSRNGLKVRTPQIVDRGTVVQVRIKEAILLGEVRYCIAAGTEFDAGIQIQDVIPRR
jgi:hypothetical protein